MKAQAIEDVQSLTGNEVYLSCIRDMSLVPADFSAAYVYFHVLVDSNQDGTIQLEQSTDLEVWEELGPTADYTGETGTLEISSQVTQRYVQAQFTNSGVAATFFTMTTGVDQS